MTKRVLASVVVALVLVAGCSSGGNEVTDEKQSWTAVSEGVFTDTTIGELERGWEPVWPHHFAAFSTNPAESSVVGAVSGDAFNGVAVIDPQSGKITEVVHKFTEPKTQAHGNAGENFVVWQESSQYRLDEFVVNVWDRQSGTVTKIGENRADPKTGEAFPSTWDQPLLIADQYAAWVENTATGGAGELILMDLGTGERTILSTDFPRSLGSFDSTLFWRDAKNAGDPTELQAIDVATKEPVELPSALTELSDSTLVVTDGNAAAWVRLDGPDSVLMVLPAMDSKPVEIKTLEANGFSSPLVVMSDVVVAPISGGGILVLNLLTGRYAINKDASYVSPAGSRLLVSKLRNEKDAKGQNALAMISVEALADIQPAR